ncbi:hypothetical protein [Streptomyces gardneri]|uniref:hypothetical protein n=1 Tax=Streptomyces gardneri TaxID=66892 RepID=UPI003697199F
MTINRRHAAMPLSFEAFRTLHHADYLTYARARLHPRRADEAVEQTFSTLHGAWRTVLGSPSPAHTAWIVLNDRLHASNGAPCCPAGALREELGTLAALGYSPEHTATLTGLPLGRVRSTIRRQPAHSARAAGGRNT